MPRLGSGVRIASPAPIFCCYFDRRTKAALGRFFICSIRYLAMRNRQGTVLKCISPSRLLATENASPTRTVEVDFMSRTSRRPYPPLGTPSGHRCADLRPSFDTQVRGRECFLHARSSGTRQAGKDVCPIRSRRADPPNPRRLVRAERGRPKGSARWNMQGSSGFASVFILVQKTPPGSASRSASGRRSTVNSGYS